jgi:hypothetical protein
MTEDSIHDIALVLSYPFLVAGRQNGETVKDVLSDIEGVKREKASRTWTTDDNNAVRGFEVIPYGVTTRGTVMVRLNDKMAPYGLFFPFISSHLTFSILTLLASITSTRTKTQTVNRGYLQPGAAHLPRVWGWLQFKHQRLRDSQWNGILPRLLLLGNPGQLLLM